MVEPVVERERARWSETCPVCGGKAMRSVTPAIWYPGVLPDSKVIFCPRHGRMVVGKGVEDD